MASSHMKNTLTPSIPPSAQDERAIQAVLIGYAASIDQRDWARLRDCFSDDCVADYPGFGRWQGPAAIVQFIKQTHADLGPTLYRITNIDIQMRDGQAFARSYVDAVLMPANEGGPTHQAIGYYDDVLSRTGQGWRIARRQFVMVRFE